MSVHSCFRVSNAPEGTIIDVINPRRRIGVIHTYYFPTRASLARLRSIYKVAPRKFYVVDGPLSKLAREALLDWVRRGRGLLHLTTLQQTARF
jgi:hypothetical protein